MVRQGPRTGGCRTGTWVWVRRGPGSGSDRALNPTLTAVSSLGPYSATYDLSGRDATAQLSEGTEGVLSKLKEPTPPSSKQGSGFSTKGPRGVERKPGGAGPLSQQEPMARASSWSHLPSALLPKLQASGSRRG